MKLTGDMRTILDISISLTGEKDYNRLLAGIVETSMDITASDAGTLYLLTEQGLQFMIMRNRTLNTCQGGTREAMDLPPVELREENVCAWCAIHRKTVNIADVYDSDLFDFSGPRKYDQMTGYHTGSMLVLPLESHEGETLGVLQLMNAMDEDGHIIAYDPVYEYIIYSIASQASISLANMRHMEDMKKLMDSMVAAFTRAIDERTPYNANHTTNVARYTEKFIDYLNERRGKGDDVPFFDAEQKEQILMAARLHDVGKLTTPLRVMNKSTRLGEGGLQEVRKRFALLRAYLEIDFLKGKLSEREYGEECAYLQKAAGWIEEADTADFLSDQLLRNLKEVGEKSCRLEDGTELPWLTKGEKNNLSIRRGTLTQEERRIMENHVTVTSRILNEIKFGEKYNQVCFLAGSHHEFLNGTGYPRGLTQKELPKGARILTIMDIFDSLISTDRPYKKPMPLEKAFGILKDMAEEGKLDRELVELLQELGEDICVRDI